MKRAPLIAITVSLLIIIAVIAAIVIFMMRYEASQAVYFHDSEAGLLTLGNAYYEVGFDKSNGGIRYIIDKATGQRVSDGDDKGNLWEVALLYSYDPILSSGFRPDGPARFQYTWNASSSRLVFQYWPDPSDTKKVGATVTITASRGKWFDLQMALRNNASYPTGEVRFPANLTFVKTDIQEALLPILPGIVLERAFFSQVPRYVTAYPGYPGVFADYMSLTSAKGSLAIYSTAPGQRLVPVSLGFDANNCSVGGTAGSTCYIHSFKPRVAGGSVPASGADTAPSSGGVPASEAGATTSSGAWTSPNVRIFVSATHSETIEQFRADDGIAQAAALQTKLGPLYSKLVESPLLKADAVQLGIKFRVYPDYLSHVPYPGLLHLVAYEPRGFDSNYPDFLPPDPQWGTTEDMAALVKQLQAKDYLVMPYTNPTWWDEKSPTMQHLPAQTHYSDVVALDDQNRQVEECYGCPGNPHYGFVMSPFVPFVKQRLEQLNQQMTKEIPSDLLFEDQIGARASLDDYNASAPAPDAYIQGWIDHTRTYAASKIMTELGFDRLVDTVAGFHGSVLLPDRTGNTYLWWGEKSWHYYPFATMAARDKVLFYQHDLAPETFTFGPGTLAWNVSFGYMLSYDLVSSPRGGGVLDPWLRVTSSFQRFVLSRYASERLMDYTRFQEKLTQTMFENYMVLTNWDEKFAYTHGDNILPPLGVLIQKKDGSFIAGAFTRFNGADLSGDSHYLIVENRSEEIIVRQPLGADTSITVKGLKGWSGDAKLEARAYTIDGKMIGKAPVKITDAGIAFDYKKEMGGQAAEYYSIGKAAP